MTKEEADEAERAWQREQLEGDIRRNLESMKMSWKDLQLDRGLSLEASYRILLLWVSKTHPDPWVRKMACSYLANDAFRNDYDPLEYLKRMQMASLEEIEWRGADHGITHVRIMVDARACESCTVLRGQVLSIAEAKRTRPLPNPDCEKGGQCLCRYEMIFKDGL